MKDATKFYIDGAWVEPSASSIRECINPATEEAFASVAFGSAIDVDSAVAAARKAFTTFSSTSVSQRVELLERIIAIFESRAEELAQNVSREIGCPISVSRKIQTARAVGNFKEIAQVLRAYSFESPMGGSMIRREPIGVCAVITPWNWPLMPLSAKIAAALAAGCTVVAKPSEFAPVCATLLAKILHDAGVPKGVFNLIHGDGPTVGQALAAHPDIDKITFTGSVSAGILIAKTAAETVKRVTQELGGKSANIILPDAHLETAVTAGVERCFTNTGQSCQAPTRMLVHASQHARAAELAKSAASRLKVGDPFDPASALGPLATKAQFEKVQGMIATGIKEGATLVVGGLGRPVGFERGYYVQPTVFADVTPDMTIAREEIFGPVLAIMRYESDDQAIEIANGTNFGLAGYVQGGDGARAIAVAERLRAGRVYIGMDGDPLDDRAAPFGGYKRSGNGRERGLFGLEDSLEVKAILGYRRAAERRSAA